MIHRAMTGKMLSLARQFPVVTVTGPRQSGKSTLVRGAFADYRYVSLEDRDVRDAAQDDPRTFLARYDSRVVIDEAQLVPDLFSYMQGVVDSQDVPGQYVLSGSQNFLLLRTISQSLAGRVAVLHLLPLSYRELADAHEEPPTIDEFLFKGGYPRIYAHHIDPNDFFPSYVDTYVDRDVRTELGVRKVSEFNTFLVMCATRIGDTLDLAGLARDCGIGVDTARSWLSILEASFVVFRLHPYHSNYGKRLVKSPKLYFYDTGLAAHLLGMESAGQLLTDGHRGHLYENAVIVEILKQYQATGREPRLFFWRDSSKNEIDLIIERGGRPWRAIEVKSSATYRPSYFSVLDRLGDAMGLAPSDRYVVYGGQESFETRHGRVIGLADVGSLV